MPCSLGSELNRVATNKPVNYLQKERGERKRAGGSDQEKLIHPAMEVGNLLYV